MHFTRNPTAAVALAAGLPEHKPASVQCPQWAVTGVGADSQARPESRTLCSVSGVPAAGGSGVAHHFHDDDNAELSLDEPDHSRLALWMNSPARTSKTRCAAPSMKKTMSTTILHSRSTHHALVC